MKKIVLKNEIPLILNKMPNTARIALVLYFSIDENEKIPGVYSLMNRLFFQGTKAKKASEIADILDNNAIELYSQVKSDMLQFKVVCLNEDFNLALTLLKEIVFETTFDDLEKEKQKQKGELEAKLEKPNVVAYDAFYKNFYKNHFYGNTTTLMLENIDKIGKQDILEAYSNLMKNSQKVFSIAGDFDEPEIICKVENLFANLENAHIRNQMEPTEKISGRKLVTVEKEDVAQAQIILGYPVESFHSKDYAACVLINAIMGSSGLSSRLFVELRDKKGLAYVVRSIYETYSVCANFNVYIATNPKNIKTSFDGFMFEINRLKREKVSQEELENAKNNVLGKRAFCEETNIAKASSCAYYEISKLGFDFEEKFVKLIKQVDVNEICHVAQKYFNDNFLLTVLASKKALEQTKQLNVEEIL